MAVILDNGYTQKTPISKGACT